MPHRIHKCTNTLYDYAIINYYVTLMYELKKLERFLRVNLLGPGPRLMKKRNYRTAVSQRLRNTGLQHAVSERRNLRASEPVPLPFITEQVCASGYISHLECNHRTSLGLAQGTDRAVVPMANGPSMTRGKISLALVIHCSPIFFISFPLPASLYTVTNMCIYTNTSDCLQTVYVLPLLPNNTAVKYVRTNREPAWRIPDIGQNYLHRCTVHVVQSFNHHTN